MTQEEKQLLLKDLCARLYSGVKADGYPWITAEWVCGIRGDSVNLQGSWVKIENVKPYLRPMSSMTEVERKEWQARTLMHPRTVFADKLDCLIDWLNEHHFDYRRLIEKGLALEAPEDMYKED